MLRGVFSGGCWVEEPTKVKEEVKQFFFRRFKEVGEERPRLDGVELNTLINRTMMLLWPDLKKRKLGQQCGIVAVRRAQALMD